MVHSSASRPRLSVVIACRDAQDVLGVQLSALARQTCPVPWEVLVCDNGSRDGTVALAESWTDRLPLRIVKADAVAGAGPARNAGVEQARGEWIGFCDADDEAGDGWLEALCASLAEHPFVAGRFEGRRLNSPRTLRSRQLDQQDGLQMSSTLVGLPNAGAGNLGIHRSVFLQVGGFDPKVRYLQDTDLCWRVQLAGYPLVFDKDLVMHVRLRDTIRGMYRQGRNYGASLASLERRYAGAADRLQRQIVLPDAVDSLVPSTAGTAGTGATPSTPLAAAAPAGDAVAADDAVEVVSLGTAAVPAEAPGTAPAGPAGQLAGRVETAGKVAVGAVRLARYFVANRSSLGAQAWQICWHVGHRS